MLKELIGKEVVIFLQSSFSRIEESNYFAKGKVSSVEDRLILLTDVTGAFHNNPMKNQIINTASSDFIRIEIQD